jgi:hypothetical protein
MSMTELGLTLTAWFSGDDPTTDRDNFEAQLLHILEAANECGWIIGTPLVTPAMEES